MIGEEPPPLPFPSLTRLKQPAKDILDAQRNPSSPDIEIKFFQPSSSSERDNKKKQKINKKSCEICKMKKIKCDNNATPDEICRRASSCPCKYHVTTNEDDLDSDTKNKRMSAEPFNNNNNNNDKFIPPSDIIPSTTVFRKPGLLVSGHYAGETSFCGYITPELQPPVIIEECVFPTIDPTPIEPPFITEEDQLYLIDVYYENLNPFYPILNKKDLLNQRHLVFSNQFAYLSPLFFYALFARACHLETNRIYTQHYNQKTFKELGDDCISYVSILVNHYKDKPRISTVLALIIMANHLEQTKLPENLTRSWLWAGEGFRLALDLGVHRSLISENSDQFGQLCIRTFWLAYITDCTISMTYGRPSATEEKVLDVTSPKRIPSDDVTTAEWIEGLNSLISLSKSAARIIKFNYSPPPPFKIKGPVKRHNAFLASVDSWLTDIMYPNNEPGSPISSTPNVIIEESTVSKRINFQKKMFLYTNLILLHRPYVNDFVQSRNSTRPSYDICTFAAIIITDIASKLESSELIYHSKSPMTAYALIMALRIHIMNASSNPDNDKFNSEKNFAQSIATLEKLPQYQTSSSLLCTALVDIREQFNNRFILSQEREEEVRLKLAQSQAEQLTITTAEAIFNPGSTEKRKERSSSTPSSAESVIGGLSVKQYQPPDDTNTVKKKKPKTTPSLQQALPVTIKLKRKSKDKQIQQSHQHVFSSAAKSPRSLSSDSQSTSQRHNSQQQNVQQETPVEQPRDYFQSQEMVQSQGQGQVQDELLSEDGVQFEQFFMRQTILHQQQLQNTNVNSINEYPYHSYLETPESFAASSMSPVSSGINSSIQDTNIDYSTLHQQQPQPQPLQQQQQHHHQQQPMLGSDFYLPLDNEDLNFENLYGASSFNNLGNNDILSGNIDDVLSTWYVQSNNNSGVSVTPVNSGSSSHR